MVCPCSKTSMVKMQYEITNRITSSGIIPPPVAPPF